MSPLDVASLHRAHRTMEGKEAQRHQGDGAERQREDFRTLCTGQLGFSAEVEDKAWELIQWTERNGADQEVRVTH